MKHDKSDDTDAQNADAPVVNLAGVDAKRYGTIAAAAGGGLIANAAVVLAVVGGDVLSLADGVAYLLPVVVLASAIHERYNPIRDTPFLGAFTLFLTIALANTISLAVKVFRAGGQSDPVLSLMVLMFVAVLFSPGPYIGAWAARRWPL